MPQLVENLKIVENAEPDSLSQDELSLIQKAREEYEALLKVGCTGCGYCMPCPNGVDIPTNFNAYNNFFLFDQQQMSQMMYNMMLPEDQRASNCQECGECEEKCPQQIGIMEELKNVHSVLHMEGMGGEFPPPPPES
jgi:hypothetical protein